MRGRARLRATVHAAALGAMAAVLAMTPCAAAGQGAGSGATLVLRLTPSPRGLALGSAMAAAADPYALEFNPAAAGLHPARAAASFQVLPMDVSAGAAAFSFGAPGRAGGVSLRFVDYGDVEVVEPGSGGVIGEPTGETATGGELTATAGYAIALGPVRVGAAARWLRLEVAGLRDDALAADLGVRYAPLEGLVLGAVAQNLGQEVEAGRAAPLPTTLRGGAVVTRDMGPLDALLAVEGRRREGRNGLGIGLEVGGGAPSLRAEGRIGFETRQSGDAYSSLVFGAGLRVDRFTVDLAYRALGPLGATRQLGISFVF